MAWRRTGVIITAVVLCSAVTGMLAYRWGARSHALRQSAPVSAANSAESVPCVTFGNANSLVGSDACITGRVLKVYTSKAGNTYLDFCEDYRACPFSSVIFSQDREKFGDLATLQGQFVEIRGLVSYYKERPQIIIREPGQLKLRD